MKAFTHQCPPPFLRLDLVITISMIVFQELNAVYNLTADQDQSQLLHKIIKESYSGQLQHNYIYDQQVNKLYLQDATTDAYAI
jgi:hypothetical protein